MLEIVAPCSRVKEPAMKSSLVTILVEEVPESKTTGNYHTRKVNCVSYLKNFEMCTFSLDFTSNYGTGWGPKNNMFYLLIE